MSTHAQQATRAREKPTGDEEAASTLKLGEFQDVPCLTLSEARLLINVVIEHRKTGSMIKEGEYVCLRYQVIGGVLVPLRA